MKIRFEYRLIIVLISLLICTNLFGKETSIITIHVEKAGSLSSYIADSKKNQISSLKLIGDLNGTDIQYIGEMSDKKSGSLINLDLSEANIVKGGGASDHEIGNYMFGSTRLQTILLPQNITKIGYCAFRYCSDLVSISIPENVIEIRANAFEGCAFTSIHIPKKVSNIERNAFYGCKNLEIIHVDNENPFFSDIDGILYNKDQTEALVCPEGKKGEISTPNSVTTIGNYAFYQCDKLTNIILPNNLKKIGEFAFRWCEVLTSISIPSNVETIGDYAFKGCNNLESVYCFWKNPIKINNTCFDHSSKQILYVPDGYYDVYWLAKGWGEFKTIIEMNHEPTANETILLKNELSIKNITNGILIDTNKMVNVYIYNINGKLLYNKKVVGNRQITLPNGIYIVSADNKTHKIVIK